jgi:adenylate cyclase
MAPARKATPLLIVFSDFSGFKVQTERVSDAEVADTMDDFYVMASTAIEKAGGRVVKFIGDAALIVFPAEKADAGVRAILELRRESDSFMKDRDWVCRFEARIHAGEAIAGEFGPKGNRRYDVLGREVNAAAMLKGSGIVASFEATKLLSPETKALLATAAGSKP